MVVAESRQITLLPQRIVIFPGREMLAGGCSASLRGRIGSFQIDKCRRERRCTVSPIVDLCLHDPTGTVSTTVMENRLSLAAMNDRLLEVIESGETMRDNLGNPRAEATGLDVARA